MFEDISRAAAELDNVKATWVRRRDAADVLGDAAGRALAALNLHFKDPDTDVQIAVAKALAHAGMPGGGAEKGGAVSLEKLAQACVKPGERTIEPYETGFKVKVRLPNGRHQAVFLLPFARKDGRRIIRVYTYCGKPTPDSLEWALRTNTKLTRGALGLAGEGNEEQFVLVCCYDDETARPEEIKRAVKDIAFHGDEIEQKMTGLDEL